MRFVVERLPKKLLAYVLLGALTSWVGPNNTLYGVGAILADAYGKRVANEDSDKELARGVAAGENTAYAIFDKDLAKKFSTWPNPVSTFPGVAYAYFQDYKLYRPDGFHAAASLEELGEKTGIDTAGLLHTVEAFRRSSVEGVDSEFGRERSETGSPRAPTMPLGPSTPMSLLPMAACT